MTDNPAIAPVQYGTLTPGDIGVIGINAAVVMLNHMDGYTSFEPLHAHVRAAMELTSGNDTDWVDLVQLAAKIVNNGMRYAVNTRLEGGKLETCMHHVDSGLAAMSAGFTLNGRDDPRGWPGSKHAVGRVIMPNGELVVKRFAVATSGIEGPNDRVASAAGVEAMVAAWELKMLALHPGARVTAFA